MAEPEVAESTVAMSLYNVVAVGEAQTVDKAREVLARYGYLWPTNALERALRQLVNRGLATVDGERIGVTGPRGCVVISRDRTDPEGWLGWQTVQHTPVRSAPLVGRFT